MRSLPCASTVPLAQRLACLFCLVGLVCLLPAAAATDPLADGGRYSLVRLWFDGKDGAAFLAAHPELDVAQFKPGVAADIVATLPELALLQKSGWRLDIVQADLEAHYAARNESQNRNFGPWHTYSENIAFLDSLRGEYPQRISAKWSIGQSHEGRDIWCVRLSSNPDAAQLDKPEVLLITMIHAREIMSGEFGLLFADHLCRNYGSDALVTWLMDNRELYLVSIANPDGVVYNEAQNPLGGGMWRKNRRDNGNEIFGVDLNRNFSYEWVGSGSSSNPSSDTYRGPSPGSEPETQALMDLINSRQFFAVQDLHTYSNLTLYPWGYTNNPTEDAAIFTHMAGIMTKYNGYTAGQPGHVLYLVNGSSNDWCYGATDEHAKIFAFCNEVGSASDGFWPEFSRRDALFNENVWPMLYLMMAAGGFAEVTDPVATDVGGGLLEPGDSGLFRFKVTNHGVTEQLANVQVTLTSDDPYLQLAEAHRDLGAVAALSDITVDPFAFSLDPACPDGYAITVNVRCEFAGTVMDYPLTFKAGQTQIIFFDDFSAGTGNWSLSNQWGLTTNAYSPPSALTDSPGGNYSNNWNAAATINGSYQASQLLFHHRYDIENNWDFARVQVAADGGHWQTIANYTGVQSSWQQVTLDLDQFAGQSLQLRFLLYTDTYVTSDGWYLDDITLLGISGDNLTPPPPAPLAPADNALVTSPVTLTVANVSDPEGDPVTYGFRIYGNSLLTEVVAAGTELPAGVDQTSWQSPPLADGTYWWRAYAADSQQRGLLGATYSFRVDSAATIPLIGPPRLLVVGQGSDQAQLQLNLPYGADLTVKVYNLRGILVRELFQGRCEAGTRYLTWDGRDSRGRLAASGVYLVKARIGEVDLTARALVVR